jgi:16S rRNA (uracil1498-N3)-methyltransferase
MPVIAERTEVKLDAERAEKRVAHWRSVMVSACEQSGRARIPSLSAPLPLLQAINAPMERSLRLTLDPLGEMSLATLEVPAAMPITIAIGPEGGWSPRDREALRAAGFIGLRLGPRILRTETAGLAAIAALQSRFGDL